MSDTPRARFRVPAGTLREGAVKLGAEQSHHLRVRRLTVGDPVRLFDGAGIEATGVLEEVGAERAVVRVKALEASTTESPLSIVLLQALPVKLPRMDDVVRQATELGVMRILPFVAERSQLPGGGTSTLERRVERWRRIVDAAAQQSGRGTAPAVDPVTDIGGLQADRLPTPRLVLEPTAGEGILFEPPVPRTCTVLVGPEGGWTDGELKAFDGLGARRVSLGPRTLRADTAGPAAIAVLQFLAGDLGDAGGD